MKLTASQRVAIEHRGSNLLVAASAGAGKTEVLARRCVALVADPRRRCGIDQLLIVTFTRAAAAELRVRVARMLREEAQRARGAEQRQHLQRQELLVAAADIGTIDAWCGRVVREHFAEAGVDVKFSILGEQDADLLRKEVLDKLFECLQRGGDELTDTARAWIARGVRPDEQALRALVARLSAFREHLVNPDQWFARQRSICTDDDAERLLAAALAEECGFQQAQLAAMRADLLEADGVILEPYCAALADWQRRLAEPGSLTGVVDDVAAFEIPKPNKRKKEPPESRAAAEVRQRWLGGRLKKPWSAVTIAAILKHAPQSAALLATVLRLEERYQQMLGAAKRQRAAYEFADVQRMALDLLGEPAEGARRNPTEIALRLQRRFAHILVDEYQDTSPVQVELLRLVTRADAGCTNRFMVGDVKQSIYGFRQAEPQLFTALIDAFEGGRTEGRVEYLSDNFRSHAGLLAALNELFAVLFDRELGGTAYGPKERLRAGRAADETVNPHWSDRPRVELHVIEQTQRRGGADDEGAAETPDAERIEREAQLAADQIRAMLAAQTNVPERRADGQIGLRPLRLADIVVLLRSAAQNAGLVAGVFRANGIHCVASGREALLDAVEVRDVCNVLTLLVNRRQDVPLAAYLRSPLVGLSELELFQARAALEQRDTDFYAAVEHYCRVRPTAALAARLDGALAQLDGWALAAREEELPALLRRIFRDSALPLLAAALHGGEQRVTLLRSLQQFAAAFSASGQGGVDDFVHYLEELSAEEIDPGAQAVGQDDVVRIMTIHAAKGLEFPVVFLLGAGARFNNRSQAQPLQCDAELGVGLRYADYTARAILTSARQHVIQRHVARRELAEELRLLYVAATRARERLIVVGHAAPGAWEACCAQYAGGRSLPLISRLSVGSRLEWVLMAAAASGVASASDAPPLIQVVTRPARELVVAAPGSIMSAEAAAPRAWSAEDEAWVARGRALLTTDVSSVLSDYPAMLSVSALKERAQRERGEDRTHALDGFGPILPAPAFAAAEAPDGRIMGTACHRFFECADVARLGSETDVRIQVDELIAAGRLTPDEAALVPVADVAWFGGTAEGQLLACGAGDLRREVPFVYALRLDPSGEQTIVRGVIDALLETRDGLVVLDYKTDTIRDAADLAARLTGYRVQLRLYAQAAGEIFERPVVRAVLVFLQARRIVDVPPDAATVASRLTAGRELPSA